MSSSIGNTDTPQVTVTLRDRALRRLLVRHVTSALSGDPADLRRLVSLSQISPANEGLRAFLDGLSRDMETGEGLAALFLRLGRIAGGRAKKELVENLIYNWGVVGDRIRREQSTEARWIPSLVVLSPSMRCNLRCTGCYSGLYSKDGRLSEEEIDGILHELRSLGIYFIVVSGGEPYVMRDEWLRLFRKYDDMYFLTYTNGTLLDSQTVKRLGRLGNVAPAISVEGFAQETEERRGPGVYSRIMRSMQELRQHGVIFGISVTYTSGNVDLVTSDEFVEYYMDRGALFGWYFMFMPVGKDPILDLVPTPDQRVSAGKRIAELRGRHAMFLADFWNDGPAVGGCLAGGRNYVHILNSGRVEPCVFAHFGTDNIRNTSFLDAVNSPFFRGIRQAYPYNEKGNLKRPCMIVDNPHVLRDLVRRYVVPAGHEHSEDIVGDPQVVEWVNRYAARMKDLTESEWDELTSDPSYRWYKGSAQYRDLFRFQHRKEDTVGASGPRHGSRSGG